MSTRTKPEIAGGEKIKKEKKSTFPIKVKVGHTIAKIYRTKSNGCDQFIVTHYLGTKRVRKVFADLELAKQEAHTVATKLSQGELNVLELKNEDRLAYVRAMAALQPAGIPLEIAAIDYAEAIKILEGSASVVEAARYFAKLHPSRMPRKTVSDVVTELLDAKEADGVSDVYLKDLRSRLTKVGEKFPGQIALVTTGEVEEFLRTLTVKGNGNHEHKLSGRSRNNYRRAIGTLFKFAQSRGYLPKGELPTESVARAKVESSEIEIFTADEMTRLLRHASDEMIPFLAIGAFAGLRHAELGRLDWAEVRLEDGFIEIKASKAKTATRRLVPIAENLKQWLLPRRQRRGAIAPYSNMTKQLAWLSNRVDREWRRERGQNPEDTQASAKNRKSRKPQAWRRGKGDKTDRRKSEQPGAKRLFKWKHNALRHSYISYRVAETQDVAKVSLEAGNSPQMIFKHYRELVRPKDAEAWFGIVPADGAEEKIVEMKQVAA
ncbi:tyrosine-type recombinase/integrase [bacterium]|nr:tyrosine-type recombinase/integrase [bacterium]